jgi:proline iminopeptidase
MQGPNEFVVNGTFKDWDRWNNLSRITIPTLLSGARFDTMGVSDVERMGSLIPRARVAICQRGSPCAMYDEQEACFRDLLQFIDDVESGTL